MRSFAPMTRDADFAREIGASWFLRFAMTLLSYRIRRQARRRGVRYSFLFMRASGDQLRKLTPIIDEGAIRPVLDRTFPVASTKEALAYVETGRAQGKVVVTMR